jgi:hypothetical protein
MAFVTKTLSNGEKLLIPISIEEMNSLLKDQEEEEEEKNKIFTMYLSLEYLESGNINEDIKRLFQVQENINSVDMAHIDEYYMWKKLNELNFKIISNKIKKIVALTESFRLRKEEVQKKHNEEYKNALKNLFKLVMNWLLSLVRSLEQRCHEQPSPVILMPIFVQIIFKTEIMDERLISTINYLFF